MIRVSVVILIVIIFLALVVGATTFIVSHFDHRLLNGVTWYSFVMISIPLTINTAAVAMFEANVIQFGMDQMLEASSAQLSAFIHWYYWSIQL